MANASPSPRTSSPYTDPPSPQAGPASTKRSAVKKKKRQLKNNRYRRTILMSDTHNVYSLSTNRSKPVLVAFLHRYCKGIPCLVDDVGKLKKPELAQRVFDVRREWNREKDLGVPASLRLGKWRDGHGQEDPVDWHEWLVSDEEEDGEESHELVDEEWESEEDHEVVNEELEHDQDDNVMLGEELEETYPWWYAQPQVERLENDVWYDPEYPINFFFEEQLEAHGTGRSKDLPRVYHADLFASQLNEPLNDDLDEQLKTYHGPRLADAISTYRNTPLAEKSQLHASYANLCISPSRIPKIIHPSILHQDVPAPPQINPGTTVQDALRAAHTQLPPPPTIKLRLKPCEIFHCHLSNYTRYKRNKAAPRPFDADADYANEETRYREAKVFFAARDPYDLLRHYVNAILLIERALDSKKMYARTDEEVMGLDEMLLQYALLAEAVVRTLGDFVTWGEREDWEKECRYIVGCLFKYYGRERH